MSSNALLKPSFRLLKIAEILGFFPLRIHLKNGEIQSGTIKPCLHLLNTGLLVLKVLQLTVLLLCTIFSHDTDLFDLVLQVIVTCAYFLGTFYNVNIYYSLCEIVILFKCLQFGSVYGIAAEPSPTPGDASASPGRRVGGPWNAMMKRIEAVWWFGIEVTALLPKLNILELGLVLIPVLGTLSIVSFLAAICLNSLHPIFLFTPMADLYPRFKSLFILGNIILESWLAINVILSLYFVVFCSYTLQIWFVSQSSQLTADLK